MNAHTLASPPLVAAVQQLLAQQPMARDRLARHAGKHVRLSLPILDITLFITEEGSVAAPRLAENSVPESHIQISAALVAQMALGDKQALASAKVTGDGLLANDLSAALDAFDWVLALRPFVGDIAAARAAQAIGGFMQWRDKAQEAVGRSLGEYATFEAGMLADAAAVHQFSVDVDSLRDDVARIEARIALLEASR